VGMQAPAFASKKGGGGGGSGSTLVSSSVGVASAGAYAVGGVGTLDDHTPASNSNRDTLTVMGGTYGLPGAVTSATCNVSRAVFQSHVTFEWFDASTPQFRVNVQLWCTTESGDRYSIWHLDCTSVERSSSGLTFTTSESCPATIEVTASGKKKSTRLGTDFVAPFTLTAAVPD
jgi:hypothetical protein